MLPQKRGMDGGAKVLFLLEELARRITVQVDAQ